MSQYKGFTPSGSFHGLSSPTDIIGPKRPIGCVCIHGVPVKAIGYKQFMQFLNFVILEI